MIIYGYIEVIYRSEWPWFPLEISSSEHYDRWLSTLKTQSESEKKVFLTFYQTAGVQASLLIIGFDTKFSAKINILRISQEIIETGFSSSRKDLVIWKSIIKVFYNKPKFLILYTKIGRARELFRKKHIVGTKCIINWY